MSYKLAIFDMDGTILSTLEDLTDSVNHVLAENGFSTRTIDEICSFVGNGARVLIERALPDGCSADTVDRILSEYQKYYAGHSEIKTCPYDGIIEMLKNIRSAGCLTAVLSNKPDLPVKKLSSRYFDGLFHISAGEKDGIPRKPAPDGVFEIMNALGVSAADTVYIGDSDVDIVTAKNAGVDCISVDWGFRDAEFLKAHGACRIVSTASELKSAILE